MDITTYLKAFLGLAIVVGLIMGLAWLLKRMGFGDALRGPLGRRRRLATVEAVMLDSRHKAVLLRRDDVEHLVLVGPNTSQVIEHGIPAPPPLPAAPGDAPPSDATPATRFSQWMRQ
jgi:flagellar protein FliO/FliZ